MKAVIDVRRNEDSFKRAVADIIADKGPEILTEAKRFTSLLKDLTPNSTKEINLTEYALKDGIGILLLKAAREGPDSQRQCVKRCIGQLVSDLSITEDAARFIVEALASALGFPLESLGGNHSGKKGGYHTEEASAEPGEKEKANRAFGSKEKANQVQANPEPESSDPAPRSKKKRKWWLLLLLLVIICVLSGLPHLFPAVVPIPDESDPSEILPAVLPDDNRDLEQVPAVVPAVVPTPEPGPEAEPEPEVPANAHGYQIDTVVPGIYDFRTMCMDNDNNLYYIDGNNLYCSKSDEVWEIDSLYREHSYLAYDANKNIMYLLVNLTIYDISDFPTVTPVLNYENCPALSQSGIWDLYLYHIPPQIGVLNDGTLIVPGHGSDGPTSWLINIDKRTVTRAQGIYYEDNAAKVVNDEVMWFYPKVRVGTLSSEFTEITLGSPVPDYKFTYRNSEALCSKFGMVYLYASSVGVCGYHTDGSVEVLIPQEEIAINDYQSLDNTNIGYLAVGSADCVAFYDNTLKCIRMIQPVQ